MAQRLGGEVQPRRAAASTASAVIERGRARRPVPRPARRRSQVWMSHGDQVETLPEGFVRPRAHRHLPRRRHGGPANAGSSACSSTRKSSTRPQGTEILRHFVFDVCGCAGDWTMAYVHRGERGAHPRAGGRRPRALRPERRRRLLGGRRPAPPGDRRPAPLRLRRQRPAALPARPSRSRTLFGEAFGIDLHVVRAGDLFLDRLAGVARPRTEAQDHRRHVHRRLRRGGAHASATSGSCPGHALPRRHRERLAASAGRRPPSRATTTWAACPTTCSSS